jgi:hypothetical protein
VNIYVVTEGKVESIVYRYWIPFVNPCLSQVDDFTKMRENNFYIVSGMGYPDYLDIIENAILDINNMRKFDRLVISIDSENMTRQEKYDEIGAFVLLKRCTRSLSKSRSCEEIMCCRFDPAPEPMPAEATPFAPPCCVSTHRSRVIDPNGPTTFLDHREALPGITTDDIFYPGVWTPRALPRRVSTSTHI